MFQTKNPVLESFVKACLVLFTIKEKIQILSSVSSLSFCLKTQDYLNSQYDRKWMDVKKNPMLEYLQEGYLSLLTIKKKTNILSSISSLSFCLRTQDYLTSQ